MRIYVRPKRYTVDDYVHIITARRRRAIDGTRLWRGRGNIKPLAARYRPDPILRSDQPCSATNFKAASRNAIWRALLGFTGRPRFTTPPFAAARSACAINRCWRALLGFTGRPVFLPGAVASRCWRLLFGSTGRPNCALLLNSTLSDLS